MLVDLPRDGTVLPALIQNTKQGFVFVLHRETGEPLFPIEERPGHTGDAVGEWYAPTQPFPSGPLPLVPQGAAPEDAWGFLGFDRWWRRRTIARLRHGSMYTPPSLDGTVISPWAGGGVNWGGAAYDPQGHWMVVNTSRLMKVVKLNPAAAAGSAARADRRGRDLDPPRELAGTPFAYQEGLLLSPLEAPCNKPPWGALSTVDLVSGRIVWEVPLGSIKKFLPLPIPWRLGTPNIGGPLVIAAGLVFLGATMDQKLRAFDVRSGTELWQAELPARRSLHPSPIVPAIGNSW